MIHDVVEFGYVVNCMSYPNVTSKMASYFINMTLCVIFYFDALVFVIKVKATTAEVMLFRVNFGR